MGDTNQNDTLSIQGINAKGYGTIALSVMTDRRLSVESKAIYAYLCSYTGRGCTCYPSVQTICEDLNISQKRYYKFFTPLKEFGYITTYQGERKGSSFKHNVYMINQVLPSPEPSMPSQTPVIEGNSESLKPQVNGAGQFDHVHFEETNYDCGKLENVENSAVKPQVNGAGQFGHVQFDHTNNKPYGLKELKDIKTHKGLKDLDLQGDISQVVLAQEPQVSSSDSPTISNDVSRAIPLSEINPISQETGRALTEVEFTNLMDLCSTAVNDNGNGYARRPYAELLDEGYTMKEIAAAWQGRQADCNARACAPEFYPNLSEFLRSSASKGARKTIDVARSRAAKKARDNAARQAEKEAVREAKERDARLCKESSRYATAVALVEERKIELIEAMAGKSLLLSVDEARERFESALEEKKKLSEAAQGISAG